MKRAQRLLIVEDDNALASTLALALAPQSDHVHLAESTETALAQLDPPPDVVLLDFALPDGTADGLLDALNQLRPLPLVIAISGAARSEDAFRLAYRGVRAYLPKPFDLEMLATVWDSASRVPPDFAHWVRCAVGTVPLRSVEGCIRTTMIDEALARSKGSRRGAARILDVSRQMLQHMMKCVDPSYVKS